ncbi:hypothetical protein H9638_00235 [Arthrobacter sp. Sa2BUA2]|uniref:Uncharacterized protein n=1 Tax=Arthrobacter pullicola TaxID=2762224 RepID=A0ABR8YDK8_9MICC|nr:hypothetical protein [Arthrobacter pullicola]MBD8042233.1 hypothetical protein [Arthrobacter pullicola]
MNSMSSNPNDEEAIRRLLTESGVEATQELEAALLRMRESGREAAPAPCAELEALFTAGVTPLRKSTRRRGFLLGGAVIAAMAAGTTGVAATSHDFWVTAETSHEAPAPFTYEEVPAPTPEPPLEPAIPAPAETAAPAPVPVPAEETPAEPVPAVPAPAADEAQPGPGANQDWSTSDRGQGHGQGNGRAERPESQWHDDDDDDDDDDGFRGQHRAEQSGGWQQRNPGKGAEDSRSGTSNVWQPIGDGSRNHGGNSAWGPGSR